MKKSIFFFQFIFSVFLFLSLNFSVSAREIADVKLSEQVTIGGETLQLNGVGIRTKFFFKIYIGALYLPAKQNDAAKILSSNSTNRIVMHFLYDEVEKEKLVDAWLEGFEENTDGKTFSDLQDRLKKFNAMFVTLHKGDVVLLDYSAGNGTQVTIKNEVKGNIEGADFNKALLSVWLGDEPVTDELKNAMLGVADE